MSVRTVGVEEEFLLVDPATGRPRAVGHAVLATSAGVEVEHALVQHGAGAEHGVDERVVRDATNGTLVH